PPTAAGAGRARDALGHRIARSPRRPGDGAVGRQGGRVSGSRLDLPTGRADAGHGMVRRYRSERRVATHGGLVPEGGVAVSETSHDATTARPKDTWATWRRAVVRRFTAVDLVTLLYVAVATVAVLAFTADDRTGWDWLLLAHALLVALVLLAPRAREAGRVGRFLGDWYPMLLLGGLYAEVGVLNVDVGYQHDVTIQRLELWVFGSQVSYRWIREWPNPVFSWIMHICYIAYYAILCASPLGLWLSGRRDAARRTIFAVMITFYLCYVVFLFFPVAGPRYAFDLAHNAATEIWPARATQWLLDRGDSWGAAFPSSHVAAAVVATICALRYWRPLGLALVPLTLGLVLSVVYGQFHYAVDAVSGLFVAGAVLASQYVYGAEPEQVGASLPG